MMPNLSLTSEITFSFDEHGATDKTGEKNSSPCEYSFQNYCIFYQGSLVYFNIWNIVPSPKSGLKPQKLFNDTESVKSNLWFQTLFFLQQMLQASDLGAQPRGLSLRADKTYQKLNEAACVRQPR